MKKIIKTITIGIAVIIGLVLIARPALSLYGGCCAYFDKKAFLAKHEFEDFSQFKNVSLFIRGGMAKSYYLCRCAAFGQRYFKGNFMLCCWTKKDRCKKQSG